MKTNLLAVARSVVFVALLLATICGVALIADLVHLGFPARRLALFDLEEARNLVNLFSRAGNQLVGVVFTTVAIAVPLTANMYSLKFLEFFLKDRVNAAMLLLAATVALNTVVVGYALKATFVPMVALHVQLALLSAGFVLLLPYLYYVFRFLHPNTLLERLAEDCARHLSEAGRPGASLAEHRRGVADSLEHIANVAVRSVDRLDRNTAIECVHALEELAMRYEAAKPSLPAPWFAAEKELFLSFSSRAVDEMVEARSWVEMKLLSQLRQVMGSAVNHMHDLTSTGAKALRRIGLQDGVRRDARLRELTVEYFNTFLRSALNGRDVRAVFILFDQYRMLAEELLADDPELVLEIAYYFRYYGQVARDINLTFAVEAIAHDLAALVRHACEVRSPAADRLLDAFLRYDDEAGSLPGVKKAQAILGSYFLMTGEGEAVSQIRAHLSGIAPAALARLSSELFAVRREKHWEVNERRMNMDYVPDAQRERLREFLESLG